MRKRIVVSPRGMQTRGDPDQNGWLDLEQIATVEITSEDPAFPIESALRLNHGSGWRASQKGEELIRIIFDEPVSIHRMQLHLTNQQSHEHKSLLCAGRRRQGDLPQRSSANNGISVPRDQLRKRNTMLLIWTGYPFLNSR